MFAIAAGKINRTIVALKMYETATSEYYQVFVLKRDNLLPTSPDYTDLTFSSDPLENVSDTEVGFIFTVANTSGVNAYNDIEVQLIGDVLGLVNPVYAIIASAGGADVDSYDANTGIVVVDTPVTSSVTFSIRGEVTVPAGTLMTTTGRLGAVTQVSSGIFVGP